MNRMTRLGIRTGLVALVLPSAALARGNDDMYGVIAGVVIGLIILFLIGRELICWYYKVNEQCRLMKDNLGELRALNESRGVAPVAAGGGGPEAYAGSEDRTDENDAWS